MPTIVGILTFMSRKNFMLSWVEHEKSFITSGPVFFPQRGSDDEIKKIKAHMKKHPDIPLDKPDQ